MQKTLFRRQLGDLAAVKKALRWARGKTNLQVQDGPVAAAE